MKAYLNKSTGISLVSGALLIIVTMVLHPSGGSIERIIEISKVIGIAHALAILSLPFVLFGFYGLTIALLDKWKLSILAFMIIAFGLVSAMFAALFNGLVLPYFLEQYSHRLDENIQGLKVITNFSFAINTPLDYIFICACCMAILIYSVIILIENKFPKWIGGFGIIIVLFALIGVLTGFVFTSLTGFRIFTFSLAAWILSTGGYLMKAKSLP